MVVLDMKRLSTKRGNPPPSELCLFSMLLLSPYFPHSPLLSSILYSPFLYPTSCEPYAALWASTAGERDTPWAVENVLEGLIAVFWSPKESHNTLISSCLMLCGGRGSVRMCTVISVGPAPFLVTKEETLEEDNASQIPQIKPHLKNDPAAVEQ